MKNGNGRDKGEKMKKKKIDNGSEIFKGKSLDFGGIICERSVRWVVRGEEEQGLRSDPFARLDKQDTTPN